ncbi:hypothetical protein ACP275_14G113600 [Erythranthe tilingii]
MEGDFRSEAPLPSSVDAGCSVQLNRSNSSASALTAENREDLHRPANVNPGDHTTWTEEKHCLYLENLEASFVKQLHQSMRLLSQCSDRNKRHGNISRVRPTNVHNASEKLTVVRSGCGEKINCKRGYPPSRVSADSPEVCTLPSTENHGKVVESRVLKTCSQKISASIQYRGDLYNSTREGSGQNFVDEDSHSKFVTETRVKRLKTSLVD